MTTWWTADLHLGHRRIIELAGRPFSSVEEMNTTIVDRWNGAVGPDDTVWVLGDVAMGPIGESLALCGRLAGHKILVLGNHDRPFDGYPGTPDRREAWAQRYRAEGGFGEILSSRDGIALPGVADPVAVSHFPYEGDSHGEDRFVEHRPADTGRWLLHGHVHGSWRVRGRQINVGCDVWDFRPITSEAVAGVIAAGVVGEGVR